MTSLIFGGLCIYFAQSVLRLPKEQFQEELDHLTGAKQGHSQGYYRTIRLLFWLMGILGVAMILLRFVD